MTKAEQTRLVAGRLKSPAMGGRRAAPGRTDLSAFRHLANGVLPLEATV
jgi:hypothetical protein